MTYLQLMNKEIIALLYTFDNLGEMAKALKKEFPKITEDEIKNLNSPHMYIEVLFIIS